MSNKFVNEFFRDVTSLGSIYFSLALVGVAFFLKQYQLSLKLLAGIIITLTVTSAIKYFFFKDRPKKESHHNLFERIDASTFPSLHAARAFFLAFLFSSFFNNAFISATLLLTAILIAYSRIYLQKHFLTDIIGGLILGGITFGITLFI